MSVSGFVKTNVSGTIALADGTGTPVTLTLAFDRGDLTVGPLMEVLNEHVYIERRGQRVNVAHGNRVYPQVSFSAWITAFQDSGSAPGDLLTFLLRTASSAYASNVSTLGSGTKVPYAVDVTYTLEGSDFGDSGDHTFTLHDCLFSIDSFTEAAEGCSISVSAQVFGPITGDIALDEYTP